MFFSGGKAWLGRDVDQSPPSNAEVKKEWELYHLSPQVPPWRVSEPLYFLLFILILSFWVIM
jgi:hypothetical protein